MGIASMVTGIAATAIGIAFALTALPNYIALVLAVIGLALGVVDQVKTQKNTTANNYCSPGIVCNVAAIVLLIVWVALFNAAGI